MFQACVKFAFEKVGTIDKHGKQRMLFVAQAKNVGYRRRTGKADLSTENDLDLVLSSWGAAPLYNLVSV